MGSVWVADHGALQTQVVVKFMHVELAGDRDSVLRFSREAAAGANVKSPHVVQVLDHGIAPDGAPFIVMELLEGMDLAAHNAKNGPMSLLELDTVISQTCKALSRAHERGIVHRDIKPQNIFLMNVGEGELFVKILDFGIAKAGGSSLGKSSATKTGAMMGTPYYMSPEQTIGAKGVDHRADLWALGVVAFECLTGQKPFDAETIGGLAIAICSGPMPMPSHVNGALSADVDRWFSRACAREVTGRFGSAKEMADALHLLVTRRPSDPPFPDGPRGSPPASTDPAAAFAQTGRAPSRTLPADPALGVTTRAPVTGAVADAPPLAMRGGKRAALAIVAAVSMAGAAFVGLRLAHRSAADSPAVGAQTAEPRPLTAPSPPPKPPVPPPPASASGPMAPSPLAPAAPSIATPTPPARKIPAPTLARPPGTSSATATPATSAKDRDSIE
jgi:serine/threonine-protein kinase